VFAADVATCPQCEGRTRLVEVATDRGDIERVLAAHGMMRRRRSRRSKRSLD
jgi:hypothetical protein